jgi:hypothetical protein
MQALMSFVLGDSKGGDGHVHFHQGPQGASMPCFDEQCPNPRLAAEHLAP